jgi:membrane associated rhomboid family serine protease
MGIYDRDYYREQQSGLTLRAPRSMVVILILVNVAVWAANELITPPPKGAKNLGLISDTLAVYAESPTHPETLTHPLYWWQFVTYGFVHVRDFLFLHLLLNMMGLWFLGRSVEERYGRWEFLWIYLAMLVLGSVAWAVAETFLHRNPALVGASGAVSGVVLLFILNYPHVTLVLFPIPIPIKAWVFGVILVVYNVYGAVEQMGTTAFGVHLAGMAFALVYFRGQWNLSRLLGGLLPWFQATRRPKLRVHREDEEEDLSQEVDRILAKIHSQGESSLTRKERRTLETASREYRKRQ